MAQAGSLARTLGPVAIALLTLSVLSPAASVFITGADVVHQVGTGAALAFLAGGLLRRPGGWRLVGPGVDIGGAAR